MTEQGNISTGLHLSANQRMPYKGQMPHLLGQDAPSNLARKPLPYCESPCAGMCRSAQACRGPSLVFASGQPWLDLTAWAQPHTAA